MSKLAKMFGISNTEEATGSLPNYPVIIFTFMKFRAGTYTSTTAVNFAPYKTLNVVLNQINKETNWYNGTPSMVLDVIGVETSSFGDIRSVTRELPCFKLLRGDPIKELKVSVIDDHGKAIDNNDQ